MYFCYNESCLDSWEREIVKNEQTILTPEEIDLLYEKIFLELEILSHC